MTQKINEFKNWLFEKTKKSDNIYSDSSKKKRNRKKMQSEMKQEK